MAEDIYSKVLGQTKAYAEHKKRVTDQLAKKTAERARATAAQAVSQVVAEAPKAPVKAAEEPIELAAHMRGRGRTLTPKPIHELGMEVERRAVSDMAAHVQGRGRTLTPQTVHERGITLQERAAVKRESMKVAGEQVTRATKSVSKVIKALPLGKFAKAASLTVRPGGVAGKVAAATVKAIPLVGRTVKPMTSFVGKRVLGPAAIVSDVATTGYAGHRGIQAYKEYSALRTRAEKLKVPMKRRGFGGIAIEAITKPNADMDPEVKVWNPKTKKWD